MLTKQLCHHWASLGYTESTNVIPRGIRLIPVIEFCYIFHQCLFVSIIMHTTELTVFLCGPSVESTKATKDLLEAIMRYNNKATIQTEELMFPIWYYQRFLRTYTRCCPFCPQTLRHYTPTCMLYHLHMHIENPSPEGLVIYQRNMAYNNFILIDRRSI